MIAMQYGGQPGTRSGGSSGGGVQVDLLWTNPSPLANFGTQTVSVDLSAYQAVIIRTNVTTSGANQKSELIMVGDNSVVDGVSPSSTTMYKRQCDVATAGVTFQRGYRDTSTNDGAIIPYQIYGIKF